MAEYRVRFVVPAEVVVTVKAEDEDMAADVAWEKAQAYLLTIRADTEGTALHADLDGIGEDSVEEAPDAR